MFSPVVLAPALLGAFRSSSEPTAIKEKHRMPQTTETSDSREFQASIGDLRKLYGVDFAKGCADNEKIADRGAKAVLTHDGDPSP